MLKKLKRLIKPKDEDVSTGQLHYSIKVLTEKYEIVMTYYLKKGSFENLFNMYAKKLINKQTGKKLKDYQDGLSMIEEFPLKVDNLSLPIIERVSFEDYCKIAKNIEKKANIKIPTGLYEIEEITFVRVKDSWAIKIKYSGVYTH